MAYDYNSLNKNCLTFYELIGSMIGNSDASNKCMMKPRILRFETQVGKCERIDKNKILDTQALTEVGTFENSAACKAKCQEKWETCTAYQYKAADKQCLTFTLTLTM